MYREWTLGGRRGYYFWLGGIQMEEKEPAGALQKSTRFPRFPISQENLRKSNLTQKIPLQALFQVDKTTYVTSYECTWRKNENRTYLCTESHTFPTEVPFHTFCWECGSRHIARALLWNTTSDGPPRASHGQPPGRNHQEHLSTCRAPAFPCWRLIRHRGKDQKVELKMNNRGWALTTALLMGGNIKNHVISTPRGRTQQKFNGNSLIYLKISLCAMAVRAGVRSGERCAVPVRRCWW